MVQRMWPGAWVLALGVLLSSVATAAPTKTYNRLLDVSIDPSSISGRVISKQGRCRSGVRVRVFRVRSVKKPVVLERLGAGLTNSRGDWGFRTKIDFAKHPTVAVYVKRSSFRRKGQIFACTFESLVTKLD
jgi:hypothetical protein